MGRSPAQNPTGVAGVYPPRPSPATNGLTLILIERSPRTNLCELAAEPMTHCPWLGRDGTGSCVIRSCQHPRQRPVSWTQTGLNPYLRADALSAGQRQVSAVSFAA